MAISQTEIQIIAITVILFQATSQISTPCFKDAN
jgi:hypothetical protein